MLQRMPARPLHLSPQHRSLNRIADALDSMSSNGNQVIIVGAGVSGLLLAQHLQKRGISYQIFERDTDLTTRGLGWGLTLHWSLPALRQLLPEELLRRLPETYVDRASVEEGRASTFPFFDLSTGELKAATPTAPESQRIRIARDRFRQLIATGVDIQVGGILWCRKVVEPRN